MKKRYRSGLYDICPHIQEEKEITRGFMMLSTYTRKMGTQGMKWRWLVETQTNNRSKQTILHDDNKKSNRRQIWYSNNLQHLSQKNLSSAFKVSVELKFFRQLVMELFCSMSTLRSKNVSSLAVTVSHLKHLVSLVSMPCVGCNNKYIKITTNRILKKGN